jgi:hypothetical protein
MFVEGSQLFTPPYLDVKHWRVVVGFTLGSTGEVLDII